MKKLVAIFIAVVMVFGVGIVYADTESDLKQDCVKLANALSQELNTTVKPEDVETLYKTGIGFTEITKLYIVSSLSGKSVEELAKLRKTTGWNSLLYSLDVKMTRDELVKQAEKIVEKADVEDTHHHNGYGKNQNNGNHQHNNDGDHDNGEHQHGNNGQHHNEQHHGN